MLKLALTALLVLSAMASASSCGKCSPQCLDCSIRGYSRLSDDQSTADCYLEYTLAGIGTMCPPIGGVEGSASYSGTPVCRRQRCTLENGERCRLRRLNEDTCMSLISSANSALNTDLNGCFAYIENIPVIFTCADGYTAACRYSSIPDFLPTGTASASSSSSSSVTGTLTGLKAFTQPSNVLPTNKAVAQGPLDPATNFLDPQGVYSVLPDVPVLRTQILSPLLANTSFCPTSMTDENGYVLELIAEGCLPVDSTLLHSDIAALLNDKTCNAGYEPLVVLGLFGCYKVIDIPNPNHDLCLQLNSTTTRSTTSDVVTATITATFTLTLSDTEGKANKQVGAPIYVNSFPKCFYRLPNQDVDPSGCQNPQ